MIIVRQIDLSIIMGIVSNFDKRFICFCLTFNRQVNKPRPSVTEDGTDIKTGQMCISITGESKSCNQNSYLTDTSNFF